MVRGELPHKLKELHEKYGEVVRVAPDELSFISPAAWRDIYAKNFLRPEQYKPKMPGKTAPNFISATEEEHTRLRKVLAPGFSKKFVRDQEPTVLKYSDTLVDKLRRRAHDSERKTATVDIVQWINYVAFDIIGDLTWGSSFDCLEELQYHPWTQIILEFKAGQIVSALQFYPALAAALDFITPKAALKPLMDMWRVTESKVRERIRMEVPRPDFTSVVMAANAAGKNVMSDEELEVNAMILVAAGSESITTLITGTINYLLRSLDRFARLNAEIRTAFPSSIGFGVTDEVLENLPFLNAVVTEGMRLCPTIPDAMRREVPESGASVAGYFVAGSMRVSVVPFAAYRSPRNFTQPDRFLPERWLAKDQGASDDDLLRFSADCEDVFNPFGVGPHNCPGQNLALVELRVILTKLLLAFDISVPVGETLPEWERQSIWWFWDKATTRVEFTPRGD